MRAARVILAGSLSLTAAFAGLVSVADVALAASVNRYVAPSGSDSDNTCTAQAKPCKTIQHAVDAAAANDTVLIAKGTYAENVRFAKSLTLRGDPAGGTKLVGGGDEGNANSDGTLQVGAQNGDPAVISLENLDISGNRNGPGVTAIRAAVRVLDSHLDRNRIGIVGVGSLIYLDGSTASGNTGSGNENNGDGVGVAVIGGLIRVERSTLSGNAFGGVVSQNQLGLAAAASAPTDDQDVDTSVVDSTVSGNGVLGVGSFAGSVDVDSSTISGNGTVGVYGRQSAITVRNSTVALTRNAAINQPGAPTPAGLYNETGRNVERSAGSAFGTTSAKLTFGKRTIDLKAAPQRRAAAAPIGITVSGTALVQTGTVPDCVVATDGGYNSSADATNSCGFTAAKNDLVRTNPRLGALANNGGPTRTYLPAAGSPLLDRIPAGQADCVKGATDQRGVARPQGPRCDIGAVEVRVAAAVKITTKSLPDGQVGDKYRKQLAATGGDGDYAWALARGSSLPDGLRLSRDGVISGTPTEDGTFRFTVTADGASKRFTLVIDASGAGPNGDGQDPIAETGAPSGQLLGWGSALVLGGFLVLMAAGHVGRRPGRHRSI